MIPFCTLGFGIYCFVTAPVTGNLTPAEQAALRSALQQVVGVSAACTKSLTQPSTCGESLAQAVESARLAPAKSISRSSLDGVTLNPFGQSVGQTVSAATKQTTSAFANLVPRTGAER